MFSQVSVCSRGWGDLCSQVLRGGYPSRGVCGIPEGCVSREIGILRGVGIPYPRYCQLVVATKAGGTHPTGMLFLSSLLKDSLANICKRFLILCVQNQRSIESDKSSYSSHSFYLNIYLSKSYVCAMGQQCGCIWRKTKCTKRHSILRGNRIFRSVSTEHLHREWYM